MVEVTLNVIEKEYDKYEKRTYERRTFAGGFILSDAAQAGLARACRDLNLNMKSLIALVLCFYFGDGHDHFLCEHCLYGPQDCELTLYTAEDIDAARLPLLDKGSLVVGLPNVYLGEWENENC